jgi:hypothetical protein
MGAAGRVGGGGKARQGIIRCGWGLAVLLGGNRMHLTDGEAPEPQGIDAIIKQVCASCQLRGG